MKKLFIIFALALCIQASAQYHDLENANWYFGNQAAVTFLPDIQNPNSISGNPDYSLEGCASVSDENGNLLFYTNGNTVRDFNHNVMPNGTGLIGGQSNTQGPVIIPKPGSDHYYIVTIDGLSQTKQGLYYSEYDPAANSGNGDILTSNKNTVLFDHNGIAINPAYNNKSEKLTSAKHCNGVDYWLLTHIGKNIYSYLVTSTGISPTPVSYTPTIFNVSPINVLDNNGAGQMKISPNGKKLAICYSYYTTGSDTAGGITFADFNNSTGQVTVNNTVYNSTTAYGFYGVEFSASGGYCYFSSSTGLHRVNINNTTLSNFESITGISRAALQLAINGKIYTPGVSFDTPNAQYLRAVNDPDNPVDPDYEEIALPIVYGYARTGLPAWVHKQSPCETSVSLTLPEVTFSNYIYNYSQYITTSASYKVSYGQNISMNAGDYIQLGPDTFIEEGSVYLARIQDCGACGNESPRGAEFSEKNIDGIYTESLQEVTLQPNPANDFTDIYSLVGISNIIVTTLDGKIIIQHKLNGETNFHLDTSSYSKGLYITIIENINGKTATKKLVVK